MNDVNQQCMSLEDGTLELDLRVNYQFGLILGVNEFRQEQQYFLEKDYLSNRGLHGYGIVSGLQVSATELPAAPATNQLNDVQISVEPGIALDQWGRPVVIKNTQCAHLRPWLEKNRSGWLKPTDAEKEKERTLYVVASYDTCTDKVAPMPAQPCSSGESQSAPIRIRDFPITELRTEKPDMPAWDAVHTFAGLLARIRIVADLPSSDEQEIIAEVRKLIPSPPSPPSKTSLFWYLPAATAREALDHIFAVWLTEVRPNLAPDLLNPHPGKMTKAEEAVSAGVLLARIDFTCDTEQKITLKGPAPDQVDSDGRPFLLPTQLIQELLSLGTKDPTVEFATLQVWDAHTVDVWVHHSDVLTVPTLDNEPPGSQSIDWNRYLVLRSDYNFLKIREVIRLKPEGGNPGLMVGTVLRVTTQPDTPIEAGAKVELTFELENFPMQSGSKLLESVKKSPLEYIGHDWASQTITIYALTDIVPRPRDLVTVSTIVPPAGQPYLSLKFQTDRPLRLANNIQVQMRNWNGDAKVVEFQARVVMVPSIPPPPPFSFFWELTPPDNMSLQDKDFLSLLFETDDLITRDGRRQKALTDVMREQHLPFVGYDGDHTIRVFHEVTIPPLVREFATLQILDGHTLHAWIHYPEQLKLALSGGNQFPLILKSDGNNLNISQVSDVPVPAPDTLLEITTIDPIMPGARVELTFQLSGFSLQNGENLENSITAFGLEYIEHNHTDGTITAYTISEEIPVLRELVTISTVLGLDGSVLNLSLRFNIEGEVRLPPTIVAQQENDQTAITFDVTRQGTVPSLHWDLKPQQVLKDKDRLSFAFNINGEANPNGISVDTRSLADIIREQHLLFVGYDGNQTISVFYEVNAPAPSIDEILRVVLTMPAQPFVTITPLVVNPQNAQAEFELWFHLNLDKTSNSFRITDLPPNAQPVFEVRAELNTKDALLVQANTLSSTQRNVFTVGLEPGSWREAELSKYLRFVFSVKDIKIALSDTSGSSIALKDYINKFRIKFEGYNGTGLGDDEAAIIAYVRVPDLVERR